MRTLLNLGVKTGVLFSFSFFFVGGGVYLTASVD